MWKPPLLDVRDVVVRYGGVTAVAGASLEVKEGEIVALIGPNGAGKTSLFNAIAGFIKPGRGTVRFDGRTIDGLPPHIRARVGLGRTFQAGRLFRRLTLRENLELGHYVRGRSGPVSGILGGPTARFDRRRDRDRAQQLIAAVGLEEYAEMACSSLPYGIQRLVEIARALCLDPRLLLLDEPSAGLDPDESQQLAEMVSRIRELLGISVLLIEHDMGFVMSIADYLYVLDFGEPLSEGTPEEVRADPAVIAAYLGDEIVA